MSNHKEIRRTFCVESENDIHLRIDSFLSNSIDDMSRSRIKTLIENKFVTVNGNPVKSSYRINSQDIIVLIIPEPHPVIPKPENIPINIIYQDSDIIVVNKPRGMVVHPGAGIYSGTLVNSLLYHCSDLSGISGEIRPGIVHRLDKGTSGVMVAAKNDKAHNSLCDQFAQRMIKKTYYALVYGTVNATEFTIDKPIKRHRLHRKEMTVDDTGKIAITHFQTVKIFDEFSLIAAKLHTGRTHQIRVHLKFFGYPVAGDKIYGKGFTHRIKNITIRRGLESMDGFYLHAGRLTLRHPRNKRIMTFDVGLPADFKVILEELAGLMI